MTAAKPDPRLTGTIWVLDLDQALPVVSPLVPAVFASLGPDTVPALAAYVGDKVAAEFEARLKSGRRCHAALVAGQLAAYGWVSFGAESIGEQQLTIRLQPGDAYVWDCATLPTFRRQHLYSALLSHIAVALAAEGLGRAWIGADLTNIISQRGMARAGFRPIADLAVARMLRLRLMWLIARPDTPRTLLADARWAFFGKPNRAWMAALA